MPTHRQVEPEAVNVGFNNYKIAQHVSRNDPVLRPGHPHSQHRGWLPHLRQVLLVSPQRTNWYGVSPALPYPYAPGAC